MSSDARFGLLGALVTGALVACGGSAPAPAAPPPPPPSIPTCEQVAPSVEVLARGTGAGADPEQRERIGPFVKAMKAQLVQSCSTDGWSGPMRECVIAAHSHADFESCERLLTPEQDRRFSAAAEKIVRTTLAVAPPPPPVPDDGIGTGIPDCDAFFEIERAYAMCDKLPQAARDALLQGLDQQREAFRSLRDPSVAPEAKKAAGDGCKQAVDALKQSATAMGCSL